MRRFPGSKRHPQSAQRADVHALNTHARILPDGRIVYAVAAQLRLPGI